MSIQPPPTPFGTAQHVALTILTYLSSHGSAFISVVEWAALILCVRPRLIGVWLAK